jgi:phosphatidylserine/phosphatidylglycerophosphate/cardiolipin synthase-like enzyme
MPRRLRCFGLLLALCLLPRLAGADQVRLLESQREAAEARAAMVLDAREEILAGYFIIGDDPFTLTALALLRDAARRGVRVKVLVDDQWNKIPKAVQAHLLQEGIEIRTYHPLHLGNLHWISRRLHDKMVVVDGEVLLAGGRNIESPYFGLGPKQLGRRNYLDCDVQVWGSPAAEARAYFLSLWDSHHVRKRDVRRPAAEVEEAARRLDGYQQWLDARIREARAAAGPVLEEPVAVDRVRFLHDPVGHKRSGDVAHELGSLIDSARESVLIESPYLVPSRAFRRVLRQARERGVQVRILTNSLGTTDNLWPQAGYVGRKKWLVRTGVELWEYQGPECLHTKAAVIDGETAVVGSFNLDPRSEKLNSEVAVVLEGREAAELLRRTMDSHLQSAWKIDGRGIPEGQTEPYPDIPRSKVCKLRLFRLLAPFIEKQL